jgi:hypothetical protein
LGLPKSRMCVIQLNGDLIWEITPSVRSFFESANDILKSSTHKEILLLQTKSLPHHMIIIRIQNRRDIFRRFLLLYRLIIIPFIETRKIKLLGRLRRPQSNINTILCAESRDRIIIGHSQHFFAAFPNVLGFAVRVSHFVDIAAELDFVGYI